MKSTEKISEATWGIALRMWWWYTWRSVLVALSGSFILGFMIGVIFSVIGINEQIISILAGSVGFIFGSFIGVLFFKHMLGKKFKGFTLVLLKAGEERALDD